jgi:hypothetical protein
VSSSLDDDSIFKQVAAIADEKAEAIRAPARLKSRIYSALIRKQQESGRLAPLSESTAAGRQLCVFEQLVQIAPVGQKVESMFFCHACHARVLAEALDNPPIWWPGCPYAGFKNQS